MAEKNSGAANEGADEFANTLRKMVFDASKEAAHLAVEPVLEEMAAMEGRLGGRIDATNQKMQAQLAQHRKDVSEDVPKILSELA